MPGACGSFRRPPAGSARDAFAVSTGNALRERGAVVSTTLTIASTAP
jgi:hypothetical protein